MVIKIKMRIIFTGGGTAGHVNPAIAIADAIKERDKSSEILFIGSKNGIENRLCAEAGYPVWHIESEGIRRNLSVENIRALYKALLATKRARKMITDFSPDAVFGTGGYICYPVVRAAHSLGIYTALHESNAFPGMAVKALSGKVDRIFVNFEECKERLGGGDKIIRSGNPMRRAPVSREAAREELMITGRYRYVLLSFGGSLGAETVNGECLELMKAFTSKREDIFHIHASGKGGYGEMCRAFSELGLSECKNISLREYIYDMPKWMTAADLVISRSGAVTLSEIAAAGRASLLIPSPNVTDDHQYKNARAFSDAGAAYTLPEGSEELKRLSELAETVISDRNVRLKMEQAARGFHIPGAAEKIAEELMRARNQLIF